MDHSSSSLSPPHQSYFPFYPSPPPPHPTAFNLNNKVSPSMLLIIIILAVIFFISGVLHLLVRFLLRPPSRDPDQDDAVTALQGQLQQLFHLHDAGVDQSFIDALPVFNYRAIIGVKDPFDCAVCLCEFESEDKLRLLPKCSHAFHMDCIDTWLLSHSTCPICRASLLADFPASCNSPVVLVLESGSESSREISHNTLERDIAIDTSGSGGDGVSSGDLAVKTQSAVTVPSKEEGERVVSVKLGKFRSVDSGGGGDPTGDNADARRCFSMGSFAYMMDESSSLQVPIRTPMKKLSSKKPSALPLTPGHRPAVSECGGDSRREFNGLEAFKIVEIDDNRGDGDDDDSSNRNGKAIGRSKKESFSVSKIWLRGRNKEKSGGGGGEDKMGSSSSRRAFSFRFPMNRSAATGDETKVRNGRRTVSEINMSRWGSELGEEIESCNGLDPQANYPTSSLARRTLLWIMGRPNKVVNHSSISSTNV